MPLIVGQEWRRRISRMQWLLNAVLAVECLSMPFFAAGAVAGMVWYGGRRMGADWGWLAGGALAAAGLFFGGVGVAAAPGPFFSRRDTAAFLDEQLGLHAALSAGEEWGNAVEAGESSVRGIPCCGYVPPGAWPGWWEARFLWLAGLFCRCPRRKP